MFTKQIITQKQVYTQSLLLLEAFCEEIQNEFKSFNHCRINMAT